MDLKNRLITPDENSTTRFEPFYQITPKELDEICKEYHAEQLRIGGVVKSFDFEQLDKEFNDLFKSCYNSYMHRKNK